jgi:glyceraldehyde-3-phosphate dehydrogenase (NADP+)
VSTLIDGASRTGTRVIEVRDPQDGRLIGTVPRASLEDVEVTLARSVAGARLARSLPTHARISILRRAAEIVLERHSAFSDLIAQEGIKTIREARAEVTRAAETLRISAEEARRVTGQTIAFDQRPGSEDRVGYWVREPIGTILAITPFNDPLNLVAHKVGPAIAAGNAVIVKPHSQTPLSAIALADAFTAAGLPPDVLQVITGRGTEIGDALVGDPRVSMVSFTGGPEVGDRLVRVAGRKRFALELGANAPVIVLPDADLDAASDAISSGAFWAAGQNCLHVQRVIVHQDVADALVDGLVDRARSVRLGPKAEEATDMGPLVDEAAAERVSGVVDDAQGRGGRIVAGGTRRGTEFAPTLIDHLPATSKLARDEVFGPVTGIIRVQDLDTAIDVANGVEQALHAAVFTRDLGSAMRVVREVQAGGVIVNDSTDYRVDAMPFGGVKASGLGREGIAFAVDEMTTTKVVCLNL